MEKFFYKIYHANLAFSAIPEKDLIDVIDKTYFPLLELVEKSNTKIGLEISAYSLEIINKFRHSWIIKFKELHAKNLIELIGSGYMQIIAPLVPYSVNIKNQEIGLKVYQELLNIKPALVYVNEQTFSQSLVDIYSEVGYSAIIMEWNNAYRANLDWKKEFSYQPILVEGLKTSLPLLWTDSILFQQFQRVVHSEKSNVHYKSFLDRYTINHKCVPIYSSDLEIFNYRPGRFETEAIINFDEWSIILDLLVNLKNEAEFLLPSEILERFLDKSIVLNLVGKNQPIIVKKQDKYSLSRWGACGRGATYINTLCYRYLKVIEDNLDDWKKLLTYWGSDFRTHITIEKWGKAIEFLSKNTTFPEIKKEEGFVIEDRTTQNKEYICFRKGGLELYFNFEKGFVLEKAFSNNKLLPFGTINHGNLDYIHFGADYYTGTNVIESFETKKITNLQKVEKYKLSKISESIFSYKVMLNLKNNISEEREWIINLDENSIISKTKVLLNDFIKGSIRLSAFTLLPDFVNEDSYIEFKNGGKDYERIYLNENEINQHYSKSLLQSSSSGLGITNGKIKFFSTAYKPITLEINNIVSSPFIMLQNNKDNKGYLTRVFFSLQELDDTLKVNKLKIYNLEYKILF